MMGLFHFRFRAESFVAPRWRQILHQQGLTEFDAVWDLELAPLEEMNTGRGGWSKVSVFALRTADGRERKLIVKRQQNHTSRSLRHPFKGVPTFEKEFASILRFKRLGIPTVDPVYYACRNTARGVQAVLITEFLDGYCSLEELMNTWARRGWPERAERDQIIQAVAALLRRIHRMGFQHNCMYPKHLFIRQAHGTVAVRIIDLEKNKWRPLGTGRRVRDLGTLHRRAGAWGTGDHLRFLLAYCGIGRLDSRARTLCRRVTGTRLKKGG